MDTYGKYLQNLYPDYAGENLLSKDGLALAENVQNGIKKQIRELFDYWEKNEAKQIDSKDISIYTGTTGSALLYLKIYESKVFANSRGYLEKAAKLIQQSMSRNYRKIKVPTFVCGEIGMLTVGAIVNYKLGRDYLYFLQQIVAAFKFVCNTQDAQLPDELLYGRTGYLYSLLLIRVKIDNSQSVITNKMIRTVMTAILESGIQKAKNFEQKTCLFYYWYSESYVGAAHGYAGILTMLLQTPDLLTQHELYNVVKPMIDFVCDLRFQQTANFPPCVGDTEDKRVQWCHGSPGVIYLLAIGYNVFNDPKYLQLAIQGAEDIWRRGLLLNGYGLCHGVSGNGYTFLRMFTLTKEKKYLYRAVKFADWCGNYGSHGCPDSENPYSMFEGMAGAIYFLADILQPSLARFPGFQL